MADDTFAEVLAARRYEPGQTYELTRLSDIFALYSWLPDERAELFLDEVTSGLRVGAASIKLVSTVASFAGIAASIAASIDAQPFRWIDDDKGSGEVKFMTAEEPDFMSLKYERAASEPSNG